MDHRHNHKAGLQVENLTRHFANTNQETTLVGISERRKNIINGYHHPRPVVSSVSGFHKHVQFCDIWRWMF